MRTSFGLKALVHVAALLFTSAALAQDVIAPNANDIAMGADPSAPLIGIPAECIPAGIASKRSVAPTSDNDKHLLSKRHYGVFECNQQLNNYCKQFLGQTGVCDSNGANCLVGCADNDQGQDTCYVGCQTGYSRTNNANQICQSAYPSDVNNCGAKGNSCAANAGAGYLANSATCNNGVCSVSCKSGFTNNNGVCTASAPTCKDGSVLSGTSCIRVGCSSNADCLSKTGSSTSYCLNGGCYAPSTNSGGLPAGSSCGRSGNASGDDNSCATGLICSGYTCIGSTNYASDIANCGSANNNCATNAGAGYLANSAKCTNGVCSVSCQTGFTNTNGVCVSNFNSDIANCGKSGNNCATNAGAGYLANSAKCTNGVCSVSCQTGFTNNNGVCTSNYNNDAANCGRMGNNCASNAGTGYVAGSATCSNGVCSVKCQSGFSAVNGVCTSTCKDGSTWDGSTCNRYNGCTTAAQCIAQTGNSASYCNIFSNGGYCFTPSSNSGGLPAGSTCGRSTTTTGDDNSCAAGLVCINYTCSSPFNADIYNCGKQGNVCPTGTGATATCTNGVCGLSCAAGTTKTATGCADLTSDESNCGKVGTVCPSTANGVAFCNNSVCTFQCNAGYSLSGSTCVSTTNDVNNCGSAGKKCPVPAGATAATCVASTCGFTCPAGTTKTSTGCVNTTSDPNNCGTAGQVCPTPAGATSASCTAGKCSFVCGPGYVISGTTCALDTSSDPNNCGSKSNVCPTDPNGVTACTSSTCSLTCNAGYVKSGTKCVPNSASQCGSATNVCKPPVSHGQATCNNGSCSVTCADGYSYNAAGNDCVASTSPSSCGPNKTVCPSDPNGNAVCVGGVCALNCNAGYYFSSASGPLSCVATNANSANTDTSCGRSKQNCLNSNAFSNAYAYCGLNSSGNYQCFASCNPGYVASNGACTPLATDTNNCGTKGNVCPSTGTGGTATCTTGVCDVNCPAGQDYNGTKCISTTSDPNNCAQAGSQCPAPANSVATCSNSKCGFTCNPSFTKTADGTACINTTSDPSNCGGAGKVCPVGTGVQSATCTAGKCGVNCQAGYLPDGAGGCKADYSSDARNCGRANNVCPSDPNGNGTPYCTGGTCGLTCTNGAVYNPTSKSCIANSPSACGASGTQCKAPTGGFGTPACNNGVCSVNCDGARTYNAVSNTCDLPNTANSCGPQGTTCPSDPAGQGTATCTAGVCSMNCNQGYVYSSAQSRCVASSDPNNCGYTFFTVKCPAPANGQATCRLGQCGFVCNAGYTPSGSLSLGTLLGLGSAQCTSTSNDPNNCGGIGQTCPTAANGQAICTAGTCDIQCNTGYDYDDNAKKCVATSNDVNNCGFAGNKCFAPANGAASCVSSQCRFACNTGYTVSGASCVLSASGKARKKRAGPALGLCPTGETACPIAGSSSFRAFNTSSNKRLDFAGTAGGYECLDTSSSLESCGGCASTGEGKDCTTIPHSAGVGCSAGQCVVFSCEPGYVASLTSAKCLKIHTSTRRHGKGVSGQLIH